MLPLGEVVMRVDRARGATMQGLWPIRVALLDVKQNEVSGVCNTAPPNWVVHRCTRSKELLRLIAAVPVRVVILSLGPSQLDEATHTLRTLHKQSPTTLVIIATETRVDLWDDLRVLAEVGIDAVAIVPGGHVWQIALRLYERSRSAMCGEVVWGEIARSVPVAVAPFVVRCLKTINQPLTVAALAELMGISRRTLVNQLAAADFPGPHVVLTACRLLVASRLMRDFGLSVQATAGLVVLPSALALRRTCKRLVGLPICKLASLPRASVLELFRESLRVL